MGAGGCCLILGEGVYLFVHLLAVPPWSGNEDPLPGYHAGPNPKGNPPPLCDIPFGCCFFTGAWTSTHSSLRMLRRVAAFCRPLRPLLVLVSFPRDLETCAEVPGAPSATQIIVGPHDSYNGRQGATPPPPAVHTGSGECTSRRKKSTKLGGTHAAKQLGTRPPHTRQ